MDFIKSKREKKQLLNQVLQENKNSEWYPTTDGMISAIVRDHGERNRETILDIGAGDGRVLDAFLGGNRVNGMRMPSQMMAIEQSLILQRELLSKGYTLVGTDFDKTQLYTLRADVIFCNPPYSVFKQWVKRILEESTASKLYFVIPQRWKSDPELVAMMGHEYKPTGRWMDDHRAIESMGGNVHNVIHSDDFLDAERKARAKVDVIAVSRKKSDEKTQEFFDSTMKIDFDSIMNTNDETVDSNDVSCEVLNKFDRVYKQYEYDLKALLTNYKSATSLPDSFYLDVCGLTAKPNLAEQFRTMIESKNATAWKTILGLFDDVITKLTTKRKEDLLKSVYRSNIEFNYENVKALVLHIQGVILERQELMICDLFESLMGCVDTAKYKSNYKLFVTGAWREAFTEKAIFEKRLVKTGYGANLVYDYTTRQINGVNEHNRNLLDDVRRVADHIGYRVLNWDEYDETTFTMNNSDFIFKCKNERSGKELDMLRIKLFKNGNMHMFFNTDFLTDLHVEFGKVTGMLS